MAVGAFLGLTFVLNEFAVYRCIFAEYCGVMIAMEPFNVDD